MEVVLTSLGATFIFLLSPPVWYRGRKMQIGQGQFRLHLPRIGINHNNGIEFG